jgi:hypothetical protein
MPLSCGCDMNAAFMPYEGIVGPVPAVTGVRERLCGTTGAAARRARPLAMKIS